MLHKLYQTTQHKTKLSVQFTVSQYPNFWGFAHQIWHEVIMNCIVMGLLRPIAEVRKQGMSQSLALITTGH